VERLNKLLAHAGFGSRRHCEKLISAGRVAINGRIVTTLATRVDYAAEKVTVDGEPVRLEKHVYWLINKPRGWLCTNRDQAHRPVVLDLVPHIPQRVYTVGRLDEASEGLLLLTNDGELAHRLAHPRFGVEKTYLVQVAGSPSLHDLKPLLKGIWLSSGPVHARRIKREKKQGDSVWLRIVLSEGKNREIRRMLARIGHKVIRLRRIAIGPVQIGGLPLGKSRRLTLPELIALQELAQHAERQEPELR
jgi:23S rRNA pseudouridine2605 synthase